MGSIKTDKLDPILEILRDGRSQADASRETGLSRERVRQIVAAHVRETGEIFRLKCPDCGKFTDKSMHVSLCGDCKKKRSEANLEKQREKTKKKLDGIIQSGVCIKCKLVPAGEGFTRCPDCREYDSVRISTKKENARENGVCSTCLHTSALEGYKLCVECQIKARERAKGRREKYKDEGICPGCKVSTAGRLYCEDCSRERRN